MLKENRACKVFKQRTDISPDIFISGIPANCGNCKIWNGKRCISEEFVLVNQGTEQTWNAAWLLW